MTGASVRDVAAIVGIGQTEISRDSGRSERQLALEACRAALADAGLSPADVDGTVRFALNNNTEGDIVTGLGIPDLQWMSVTPLGGADSCMLFQHAVSMIAAGARAVLVYRSLNGRSGKRYGQPSALARPPVPRRGALQSRATFIGMPELCALPMQRYLHRTGTTSEHLGHYAVNARAYAAGNPRAYFHGAPITLDDHQQSRWIAEPVLRLLDCALEVDVGVALVVTSTERARDLPHPPATITSASVSVTFDGNAAELPGAQDEPVDAIANARQLWSGAGLGPHDMDAVMIYDNFSPVVHLTLEGAGFCRVGEAKDFVADGNLAPDGALPCNTHGGHLGEGYLHGVGHVVEAVRQLRGESANQLAKPVNHVACLAYRTGVVLSRG